MDKYPLELIPKREFKKIDFANRSCINAFTYLIRDTKSKEILDDSGKLKSEFVTFQTDHLKDYSTNLLGVFKEKFSAIVWQKDNLNGCSFFDPWNCSSEITDIPILNFHFVNSNQKGVFYLRVEDFLNKEIISDSGEKFKSRIIHTPTNCNFWHCSLRWDIGGIDSSDLSKGARKKFLAVARSYIIEKAIFNRPKYQSVLPKSYTK